MGDHLLAQPVWEAEHVQLFRCKSLARPHAADTNTLTCHDNQTDRIPAPDFTTQ